MKAAPHPRQAERLQALRSYDILDTPREADFDELVELASAICDAPISVINLIDANRQWFKAEVGLGVRETPLDTSICSHVILESDFVEIGDTLGDHRMVDNPLCTGDPGLRFYAGALLKGDDGLPLGTLCVLDYKPRSLTAFQKRSLQILSKQIMTHLDLRLALRRQVVLTNEIDHRVKNSLQAVSSLVMLQRSRSDNEGVRDALDEVSVRLRTIALLHEQLYRTSTSDQVDLAQYLGRLGDLLRANAPDTVTFSVHAAPLLVDSRCASSVGMIVSEFAANSLKHAFPDGRAGKVRVSLRAHAGMAELICEDDGAGFSPAAPVGGVSGSKAGGKGGLGLRIIDASVAQLHGSADKHGGTQGFRLRVTFPL